MPFSGVDPTLLLALARHLEHEVAPLLGRNAAVALDVLERQDLRTAADLAAFRLNGLAAWAEDAAFDLKRRAGIVEDAQHVALWAAGMSGAVRRGVAVAAEAVVDGEYTGDAATDIEDHLLRLLEEAVGTAVGSLRAAIRDGDAGEIARTATEIEALSREPWFDEGMARLFGLLGPVDTARLVAVLAEAPANDFDDETLLVLAGAFAAATRGGLGWDGPVIVRWFDQGATGAAQLLRAGDLDPAFLHLVIATIGLAPLGPDGRAADPELRFLLAPGSELWQRVGVDAGDHRAVLLDALTAHPDLAIGVLADEATLDMLLTTPWEIDQGRALGRLLVVVDAGGDAIDPAATDHIRRRVLRHAADPTSTVPAGLRPALGGIAATHIADLAFSLAVPGPVLDLDADGVRRIVRLCAEDADAFNRLLAGYAGYVADSVTGDGTTDHERHLSARADELGALTFALAYTDREIRTEQAGAETAARLSALDVLGFLASGGTSLLPGPLDHGAEFVVSRLLRGAAVEQGGREVGSLEAHNDWKRRMLDDLEYVVAVEMARHGLLPGLDTTVDPADRSAFLVALEGVDGPLEVFMAIVESQARRQREAIAHDG